jgi:hypothetical protein
MPPPKQIKSTCLTMGIVDTGAKLRCNNNGPLLANVSQTKVSVIVEG